MARNSPCRSFPDRRRGGHPAGAAGLVDRAGRRGMITSMRASPDQVRADFDRIALLADDGRDHSSPYDAYLLQRAPARCRAALDVGSGTGAFSRLLAARSDHVLGVDLSPEMVRVARE